MLVLSRKMGEKIQIGDGITVIVTRIAGNRVTLGVSAPREMRIVRSELKPLSELRTIEANSSSETVSRPMATSPGTLTVEVSPGSVAVTTMRRPR